MGNITNIVPELFSMITEHSHSHHFESSLHISDVSAFVRE